MTVYAGEDEQFIVQRLRREKRCGTVTQIDDTNWLFSADVYYADEMLKWLRKDINSKDSIQVQH